MRSDDDAPGEARSGREAEAVIVFADIVGCSQISDALGLREYADFIHELHETARATAEFVFGAYHYAVNTDYELSIRGDEACVILHRSPAEDIQRALTFAVNLQLLWLASRYNRQRLAKMASPVELGIGIHAGTVYIDKFQHDHPTSEGYSINVAKRIEGHTRDGVASKIMISSQAFAHLAPEHRGLSFMTAALDEAVEVRGVQGAFVLRELVDIDETLILDLKLPQETFDEKLLGEIKFVAETRVDAPWLGVLWRVAYGVTHGQERLFRYLSSRQTEATRNTYSWFLRAKRELEAGDFNMAATLFELAASAAVVRNSVQDGRDARAWALYNAALAHEHRKAFASAITCYQRALRYRPGHPQYQVGLIAGYLKAGRADDALSFLRDIRDEFSEDSQRAASLYLEGVCLGQLGDNNGAASCRAVLDRRFYVEPSTLPPQDAFLTAGVDAGDVVLKAFQNVKSLTRA